MIKALLILTKSGSCKYYKMFDPDWAEEEKNTGVISYVSAVSLLITELGEKAPKNIHFGTNEIVCEDNEGYILSIVTEKGTSKDLVAKVKKEFKENFVPIEKTDGIKDIIQEEQERFQERTTISNFVKRLNLLVNKRTNTDIRKEMPTKKETKKSKKRQTFIINDVDLLITTETGQPVYLMQTLFLPYDAVLLVAFVSAILDIGKEYGLGDVTSIESEELIIYIEKIEKAFTIVITKNKEQKVAYRRFIEFVTSICNDWLSRLDKNLEEAFEIFEQRKTFEKTIKLLVDTETWEKHQIKQYERKTMQELGLIL